MPHKVLAPATTTTAAAATTATTGTAGTISPASFAVQAAQPWPRRTMAGTSTTLSEGVVRRAVAACQRVDPSARLSSMAEDQYGQTCVRLRCGDAFSMPALQRALQVEIPFAITRVVESVLDAYIEISLTIPARDQERRVMRAHVTKRRLPAYLIVLGWALLLTGVVDWVSTVRRNRSMHAVEYARRASGLEDVGYGGSDGGSGQSSESASKEEL